jgi:hypothetical protein
MWMLQMFGPNIVNLHHSVTEAKQIGTVLLPNRHLESFSHLLPHS